MNDALYSIFKFVLAVLLLPVAWATASEFHYHVIGFSKTYGEFFYWGMFGFLLLYVFFYQFWGVYELGQKLIEDAFKFMSPANKFMANIVPFYLTALLLLFYITINFLEVNTFDHYFMFFAGFAFTMHVILTAQELQEPEKAFIKPTYLISMVVVSSLVICITVLLFDLVFVEFTFPGFVQKIMAKAQEIYLEASDRMAFWGK